MVWKNVLGLICDQFQLTIPRGADSITVFMEYWASTYPRYSALFYIPHHTIWAIWKAHNRVVFYGKKATVLCVFHHILNAAQLIPSWPVIKDRKIKIARQIGPGPSMTFPCGYFDGASTPSVAGSGYSLFLNENHHLDFALGVGYGSNTKAELLGLWALLHSSQMMGIPLTHIYGDSQVIINWAKGITTLPPPELYHWCRESQKLISSFQDLSFSHIYREHNWIADHLSKISLSLSPGFGCFSEFMEDHLVSYDSFQLF